MIYLPITPAGGGAVLAAYLRADPSRALVAANICARLESLGRVGDNARFYIIRSAFRRAVFRGMLVALRDKLPSWARETAQAAADNRAFMATQRDEYLAYRRAQRSPARTSEASLAD